MSNPGSNHQFHEAFLKPTEVERPAGTDSETEEIGNDSEKDHLLYDRQFRQELRALRHGIATFHSLEAKSLEVSTGTPLTEGGMTVVHVFSNRSGSEYFRVEFGGKRYFVKREERFRESEVNDKLTEEVTEDKLTGEIKREGEIVEHTPAEEIRSAEEARALLAGLDSVRVLVGKLAFRDRERSYFVSPWAEGTALKRFIDIERLSDRPESQERLAKVQEAYYDANEILEAHGFADLGMQNVMYDKENDQLVFFDLHRARKTP